MPAQTDPTDRDDDDDRPRGRLNAISNIVQAIPIIIANRISLLMELIGLERLNPALINLIISSLSALMIKARRGGACKLFKAVLNLLRRSSS